MYDMETWVEIAEGLNQVLFNYYSDRESEGHELI